MKPTVNEKLNQALGMEVISDTNVVIRPPSDVVTSGNSDIDMQDDFDIARTAMHNILDKGMELVDNANFFAREKQDARSVEAAAMAQKEARESALAIITLHKTRKEIERATGVPSGGDTTITQNAVFVGTTGELLKMTKDGLFKDALKAIDVKPEKQ